jgi:Xaa-Pro aminopeptidase
MAGPKPFLDSRKEAREFPYNNQTQRKANPDKRKARSIQVNRFRYHRIAKYEFNRLCVDFHFFTLDKMAYFRKPKIIDISRELYYLRSLKEESEINNITGACKYTTKCFNLLIKDWKKYKFKTEQDVSRYIKIFALHHNLELSFIRQ